MERCVLFRASNTLTIVLHDVWFRHDRPIVVNHFKIERKTFDFHLSSRTENSPESSADAPEAYHCSRLCCLSGLGTASSKFATCISASYPQSNLFSVISCEYDDEWQPDRMTRCTRGSSRLLGQQATPREISRQGN
ncbi:hypothetical protein MPSEU_000730000 [Mayamaea pseudoterrestris]|nr:hypothetical protein MPSEU_000730000 [Mayamaea pseudoterrestris]